MGRIPKGHVVLVKMVDYKYGKKNSKGTCVVVKMVVYEVFSSICDMDKKFEGGIET